MWYKLLLILLLGIAVPFSFMYKTKPVYNDYMTAVIETQGIYETADDGVQPTVKEDWLYQGTIERIVVHHTAFEQPDLQIAHDAISRSHMKRWTNGGINLQDAVTDGGSYMMYHRLIGEDGTSTGDRALDQLGWGTKKNNVNTFHIALVGNFNNHPPSEAQYKKLNDMISYIRSQYGDVPVYGHGQLEGEATQCPGKMFDYTKLVQPEPEKEFVVPEIPKSKPKVIKKETPVSNGLITFSLSRYYSVVKGQNKYYNNKTYEEDFRMNCSGDCLVTANGTQLSMANKNTSVACPPAYPLGTKIALQLRDGEHIVTCNDRGSAIQGNRLDMYCGVGDEALDNRHTCITGNVKGKVIS